MSNAAPLFREVVRRYIRAQRIQAKCDDGASTVQCHILTELWRDERLPQRTLAERLGLDKGWISRAVDALVAEGLVTKQPSELDRRSVELSLTLAGRSRAQQLEGTLIQQAARVLDLVPSDRQAQVQESLQLLLDALSAPPACRVDVATLVWRPAVSLDWPAVEHLLVSEGLPVEGAREHLANFTVGELDGDLVCAGGLEIYGTAALLRSLVVHPNSRGRGLGQELLSRLQEQASERRIARLFLLTTTATTYFARLGFRTVPRSRIPERVRRSREFQGACPAGATAMSMNVRPS